MLYRAKQITVPDGFAYGYMFLDTSGCVFFTFCVCISPSLLSLNEKYLQNTYNRLFDVFRFYGDFFINVCPNYRQLKPVLKALIELIMVIIVLELLRWIQAQRNPEMFGGFFCGGKNNKNNSMVGSKETVPINTVFAFSVCVEFVWILT